MKSIYVYGQQHSRCRVSAESVSPSVSVSRRFPWELNHWILGNGSPVTLQSISTQLPSRAMSWLTAVKAAGTNPASVVMFFVVFPYVSSDKAWLRSQVKQDRRKTETYPPVQCIFSECGWRRGHSSQVFILTTGDLLEDNLLCSFKMFTEMKKWLTTIWRKKNTGSTDPENGTVQNLILYCTQINQSKSPLVTLECKVTLCKLFINYWTRKKKWRKEQSNVFSVLKCRWRIKTEQKVYSNQKHDIKFTDVPNYI